MPRLLICDNEEPMRALVRAALDADGYELLEAADGDEALELCAHVEPDLVLLDVKMPGRSGLDVLSTLRADRRLAATKVVIVTAGTWESEAASAGADCFVAKPFNPAVLAAAVARLLRRPRQSPF